MELSDIILLMMKVEANVLEFYPRMEANRRTIQVSASAQQFNRCVHVAQFSLKKFSVLYVVWVVGVIALVPMPKYLANDLLGFAQLLQ